MWCMPDVRRSVVDELATLVRERLGLQVTALNANALERFCLHRLEVLGVAAPEYLELLRQSGPESVEFDAITQQLTVGETYFFRGAQFPELRQRVLPELIERRRRQGSCGLRVLSAGCATGEEPYAIAMLLSDLLPDFERWQISILG